MGKAPGPASSLGVAALNAQTFSPHLKNIASGCEICKAGFYLTVNVAREFHISTFDPPGGKFPQ
jgi:hypothetical protein